MLLPIEVLGSDGTTVSQPVSLTGAESASARSLWLQVHELRYPTEASVQVNSSPWIPLRNETVIVAIPGKTVGGIGVLGPVRSVLFGRGTVSASVAKPPSPMDRLELVAAR